MSTRSIREDWCPWCQTHLLNKQEMYIDGQVIFESPKICVVCQDKLRTGELVGRDTVGDGMADVR